MKKRSIFLFCMLVISTGIFAGNDGKKSFRLSPEVTAADYQSGTIIFKINPEFRNSCSRSAVTVSSLNERMSLLQTESVEKLFPNHNPPDRQTNSLGQKLADLSLIYILKYSSSTPIEEAVNMVLQDESVEYAEPAYILQPLYIPNDTAIGLQYQLVNVRAFQGWDISKGDTNIVIGITDTGTDLDHPDLINQLKYNYADPINGIDDDGDGFVDNFRGWDMVGANYANPTPDNDPSITSNSGATTHGSIVAGCAVAEPDNITGVAGTGFLCKYLPVKIADNSGNITIQGAYGAITYAADHGCQIINCSWGGTNYAQVGGQMGQDVIDYATINKNCLVVAGAGNNNFNTFNFWPASYQHVLSVGGTTQTDAKWSSGTNAGSNWGPYVDITAPSYNVYSTTYNNSWTYAIGTSFATPIVSGCIGVVLSHFPSFTPKQAGEQLRATSDDIDTLPANAPYKQQIGKGRANLYRALTESSAKSVRMEDIILTDIKGKIFKPNDTIPANDSFDVTGKIINWLEPVSNLTITMTVKTTYVTISNGTVNVPSTLATLAATDNNSSPFQIATKTNVPLGMKAVFILTFTDASGYSDYQSFQVFIGQPLVSGIETNVTPSFYLEQNYPNPFSKNTSVNFALYKGAEVNLSVYDVAGQNVMTIADGKLSEGNHTYVIDGKELSSGIYYFVLKTEGAIETKKMVKM